MIYLIGDLQGCCDAFERLLATLDFSPSRDRLYLLGDLVNRGPCSLKVLERLAGFGDAATCLLGNHDLHLLAVALGVRPPHRSDTLDDILAAPDRDALLDGLRQRPLAWRERGVLMVHAGVLPQWTAAQTLALAGEVEAALAAPGWREFLAHLWGSEPAAWRDDLAGWPRLRVIVNAMTRMRFCTPDGVMDFHAKGEVGNAPPGCVPWFEVPGRRSADTTLVTGHWSALGLKMLPNLLALDSGCLWGGPLTAVRLEDRAVFQVPCSQEEIRAW